MKDINFRLVGRFIALLREKENMNQEDLAKELCVTKSAISQWESGTGIKTENIYRLAKYFGITVEEILNGQFTFENEEEYFGRNFDLSNPPDFSEINDENVDDLDEYLHRCYNVIKRFFKLIALQKERNLTANELEELRRISKYFVEDYEFRSSDYPGHLIGYDIYELYDELMYCGSKIADYQLSKYFYLNTSLDSYKVIAYSDYIANKYFSLLSQQQLDALLTEYCADKNVNELDNLIIVKRLLKAGARCLFSKKSFNLQKYYSEKDLKYLKGEIKKCINESAYYQRVSSLLHECSLDCGVVYDPYSWRHYSYDSYEDLVDEEFTNFLKKRVFLKEEFPIEYYKFITYVNKSKLK